MAHPQTAEAVGVPAGDDLDSAAAAIAGLDLDDVEDDQPEDDGEPEQGEPEDDGDEADEEGDEPDQPAIDPPASLNAEEKATFAQLPKEAQQAWAASETRRNTQVQEATTKAADAQRAAEARAAQADAEARRTYAQQVMAIAEQYAPQPPDPMLAQQDPGAYLYQKALYDQAKAQHDHVVQQATSMGQQAEVQLSQTEVAERDRQLMAIPEVQNPETREAFFNKAIGEAQRLGLDMSQVNYASAAELKALREIADLREKASKYDAAMAKQMTRVRDGKRTKAMKPNASQAGQGDRTYRESRERLRQSGSLDDAAAAIARLG